MPLTSFVHGLSGRADVIELQRSTAADRDAVKRDGTWWRVRPVEYKRGKPKKHREDEVQLCAQALCLEEMLDVSLAEGDLFYGTTRRRKAVAFDATLRELTASIASRMHAMFTSRITPRAEPGPKCRNCSLNEICRPYAAERSASRYVRALFRSTADSA